MSKFPHDKPKNNISTIAPIYDMQTEGPIIQNKSPKHIPPPNIQKQFPTKTAVFLLKTEFP